MEAALTLGQEGELLSPPLLNPGPCPLPLAVADLLVQPVLLHKKETCPPVAVDAVRCNPCRTSASFKSSRRLLDLPRRKVLDIYCLIGPVLVIDSSKCH